MGTKLVKQFMLTRLKTHFSRLPVQSTFSSSFPRAFHSLRLAMSAKRIGTHSGTFHCDEALAVYMLRQTASFKDAPVVRSRDPTVLERLDIVVDVGGVYDPSVHRYDHHQRGFDEHFAPAYNDVKLSSAGLVYRSPLWLSFLMKEQELKTTFF